MNKRFSLLFRLAAAFVIALAMLYWYEARINVPAEDFALGDENFHGVEMWDGMPFTASSVDAIADLVERESGRAGRGQRYIAWFGNSQLHTINQFKQGDHLAPYWFRKMGDCSGCALPLGLSLPNANLQEHYALAQYASSHLPVDTIILEVVYDDLREDGLRADFSRIWNRTFLDDLVKQDEGKEIVSLNDQQLSKRDAGESGAGSEGHAKSGVEEKLTTGLGNVWPLWKDRANLRSQVLEDLYYFRNWALNIKPTTVRRMIPPRYERNMRSLNALLESCEAKGIKVVLYIAPIRQDVTLPYDVDGYARWKDEVEEIAKRYSAVYLNLEKLVPGDLWGTYHEDNVDFMHFQGEGHKLVARAIYAQIQKMKR